MLSMVRFLVLAPLLAIGLHAEVSFNRDIRPIMADTCFRCHGPDRNARMMGLRLDIRDEALKKTASGVTPIIPGDPDHSAIVQRVFATNLAHVMPPLYSHKELTTAQKETIREWVAEGAKYEGHWAYQPIRRPPVPVLPNSKTIRNPIDAFIEERLATEGISPSAEADPRTLIRRVTLDLTGLPPTPADVEQFVRNPESYEAVVDRLLASQAYAEKQAMHWLDAVRYADTCGFHGDNPVPAWPYRDYVLRAFRDNKPFDQFTREQLAGDLLPNATTEQEVASAYNRILRTSAEGGLQPKEYLAKYGAERVRTTAIVWLGSTMGCAECHDHKFDPFTSRDFYSMKAFFADIEETGLVPDRGDDAWGVQLALPSPEQKSELEQIDKKLQPIEDRFQNELAHLATDTSWEKDVLDQYEAGKLAWRAQRPLKAESGHGAILRIYNDEPVETTHYTGPSGETERVPGNGLIILSGPNPDRETYTVTFQPGAGRWTALGLQITQDESLPSYRIARGSDRLVITEVEAEAGGHKLPFVLATDNLTYTSPGLPPYGAIDGNSKTGWGVSDPGNNLYPFLALRFEQPLETNADTRVVVRIHHDSDHRQATIGRFRLALSSAEYSWPQPGSARGAEDFPKGGMPPGVLDALQTAPGERTQSQYQKLASYALWRDPKHLALLTEVDRLRAHRGILDDSIPRVVVTRATVPTVTHVLPRGNWMDDSGAIVEPAIPAFLGKLATSGRATRLDLANFLVSKDNPLTARVFVNRTWREFFGYGLTRSLDDLGSQGEWPSHPELLDWLAAEFMEHWDVKHLIRTIVLSHTYRQSSISHKYLEARDPENRLLARQNRFRVDAEVVHDIALRASGLLVDKFGGPSVRPYQPVGYLAALNFPKRAYSASVGDDLYRRGVYTHWQRTFLHPALQAFDAPSREECTVNRVNSNTPLQALDLLNDPIYVEAARVFAQHIASSGGATWNARLDWAFERAVSRPPSEIERSILSQLYNKNLARFEGDRKSAEALLRVGDAPHPDRGNPAELAAWTTVARAILNMHETITRN